MVFGCKMVSLHIEADLHAKGECGTKIPVGS